MNNPARLGALNKFKSPAPGILRQTPTRVLVIYDVVVKVPEVPHVPLIVNYGKDLPLILFGWIIDCVCSCETTDLPKAVEEYAHRFVSYFLG